MTPRPAQPHIFVVLGGTGDPARRKLLSALFRLRHRRLVPANWALLAAGRDPELTEEAYRDRAAGLDPGPARAWCGRYLYYQPLPAADADDYGRLARRLGQLEQAHGLPGNRVFYLAIPPAAFPETIAGLGRAGLNRGRGWVRLVVAKPFGLDLASARTLNGLLHRYFGEEQVYRIDHYLGKETVQNLLVFRF